MINLLQKVERHLIDTLGISVAPVKWEGAERLPFFLRELYAFFQVFMLDTLFLLMVARNIEEQTPATVRKHMMQVREKWGHEVVYVHPSVSSYNRKRLIEHKVPFVVPGNQIYLPLVGLDLREHFRKIRSAKTSLGPATQVVVLHAILYGTEQGFTPSGMANRLGYAAMTMTRAFDELESVGLGEVAMDGRERVLRFRVGKKTLWEKAQEFLRSPIKRKVHIMPPEGEWPGIPAGLTALAHYSLLAPPANPVYAVSMEDWKLFKQRNPSIELTIPEPKSVGVEIWSYSPHLFAKDNVVDKFSLYLSLKDNPDERVASAIEMMMEGIQW